MIYRLFRVIWSAALFGFFRRIDVQRLDHVPARGPVLLAANHSNAFVDALVILTRVPRPVTLTAKSTLSRNPLLRVLMRALNVVEFHRRQDEETGADPARNTDAMEECRRRLAEGGAICIFPEGISHSDPALRPFRTGAARIALDFLRSPGNAGEQRSLAVVPVGLHFEAKERFRSAAAVVFGEPFGVAEWLARHPAAGAPELTAEIEARIRGLTINARAEAERETFTRAAELLAIAGAAPAPLGREEPQDVAARVRAVHRLQAGEEWLAEGRREEVAILEARISTFYRKLRQLGITAAELFLPIGAGRAAFFVLRELEILLVGLPLALWGIVNHGPAYGTLRVLVRKLSTDRDHFASNAVVMSVPAVPLFYGIQIALVAMLAPPFWTVLYALSLPLSGTVALLYRDRAGGVWQRTRTFLLFLRRPEYQRRLIREAAEITGTIHALALEFEAHA